MGVSVQQLPTSGWRTSDCTYIPPHLQGVFNEFLKRYQELEVLRKKESSWLVLITVFGLMSWTQLIYLYLPLGIFVGVPFLFFLFSLKKYLSIKRKVSHTYVNVHILYHHFLGKLEVGFCKHESSCHCVEEFKRYVWRKYRISFYGKSL